MNIWKLILFLCVALLITGCSSVGKLNNFKQDPVSFRYVDYKELTKVNQIMVQRLKATKGFFNFEDNNKDILMISLGKKLSNNYKIEITSVTKVSESVWDINIKEVKTQAEKTYKGELFYPFILVDLEKMPKEIRVKNEQGSKLGLLSYFLRENPYLPNSDYNIVEEPSKIVLYKNGKVRELNNEESEYYLFLTRASHMISKGNTKNMYALAIANEMTKYKNSIGIELVYDQPREFNFLNDRTEKLFITFEKTDKPMLLVAESSGRYSGKYMKGAFSLANDRDLIEFIKDIVK